MWSPALAVFTTLAFYKRSIRELNWQWGKTKYIAWCLLIPSLYSIVAYAVIFGAGLAEFDMAKFEKLRERIGLQQLPILLSAICYLLLMGFIGTLSNMASSLGEEIGWRGFLVPAFISRTSFIITAVLIGLIWAAWHYPLMISNYKPENNAPLWYLLTCYTVRLVFMSVIYTWFTVRAQSIWPAVVLHSSHNLFVSIFSSHIVKRNNRVVYWREWSGAADSGFCFRDIFLNKQTKEW
jgi:membrane protease YdiL (CAAX protease family)